MRSTRYLGRLPKGWSYPVSAEAIAEALASVPRADQMRLYFYGRSVQNSTEFHRLSHRLFPNTIMQATHNPRTKPRNTWANLLQAWGYDAEKWELIVFPVLSESEPVARQLLLAQGLPAIENWLRSAGRADWSQRWHHLNLIFDPKKLSLTSKARQGA